MNLPALTVVLQEGEVGDGEVVLDGAELEFGPGGVEVLPGEVAEGDGEVGMKAALAIAGITQSTPTIDPLH